MTCDLIRPKTKDQGPRTFGGQEMAVGRDFKKIRAWKLAHEFVFKVYEVTNSFPRDEKFGVVSQLRRAALSVPTNIAEGASYKSKKRYLNSLHIGRGSLAEVEYLLIVSHEMGFVEKSVFNDLECFRRAVAKTLYGLIMSVSLEC